MLRTPAVAIVTATVLVALAAPAWAHASFDVRQVPAGSTQDLVLRVPIERASDNDVVEVLVPGAFTVTACDGAAGWTCDQAPTADDNVVVTLRRAPDGPGDTEQFSLTVTAPQEEGVYAFPTIQTYADGEEAAWIGDPSTDRPAPRIQVGDETTEVELSGEATPHTDPVAEPTAEPTTAPTEEPAPDAPSDESPTAEGDDAPPEDSDGDAAEDTGSGGPAVEGGPSLLVVGIGVALLVAFTIAALIARRRR